MFSRSNCLWGRLKTTFRFPRYCLFLNKRNSALVHRNDFHWRHKHYFRHGVPAALSFSFVKYYCKDTDDDDHETKDLVQSSVSDTKDSSIVKKAKSKDTAAKSHESFAELKDFFGSNNSGSAVQKNSRPRETGGIFTIPNVLCFFRLAISPYIAYLVVLQKYKWALGLTFVAGFTDLIDGWIARNFKNQSSILGTYIDPLADKVLISSLVLSLTYAGIIPIPLCALMVGRDIAIMTASFYLHFTSLSKPRTLEKFLDFKNAVVKMEPTEISKWNTTFQLLLVAASLGAPVFNYMGSSVLKGFWLLVGSTTVLSGFSYVIKDTSSYIVK